MKKKVKVSISHELYKRIKKRVEETGFKSVEEYIEYVLSEVLSDLKETKKEETFSKEDEEKVKDRLRALGYLD